MKKYLAVWHDSERMHYETIYAEDLPRAKHKAFMEMCDYSGDRLYDVEVYEMKYKFDSADEFNPSPKAFFRHKAIREYSTGKLVIRRAQRDGKFRAV